jgi:uncharacterized coiled-coil protein SlyX
MQLQIMQAENQENQQCIKKLKEIITDKEQHIENLQKEIARIAERLCTAESRLYELQND